ncbi:MAG: group I truncated hemoglobin [Candidatus Rokuibacteriota bacterium]
MRSGHVIGRGLALVLTGLAFAACAARETRTEPSLYQRLGGRDAISGVVDEFVANVVKDDRINARFKTLQPPQVAKLKTNLSDQICAGSGGPCAYLGKDMKTAHEGMKITEAEWSATVEALVKALDKFQVPAKEKGELLALLGPMKKDIVGQ